MLLSVGGCSSWGVCCCALFAAVVYCLLFGVLCWLLVAGVCLSFVDW